jgi:hypothetical protein
MDDPSLFVLGNQTDTQTVVPVGVPGPVPVAIRRAAPPGRIDIRPATLGAVPATPRRSITSIHQTPGSEQPVEESGQSTYAGTALLAATLSTFSLVPWSSLRPVGQGRGKEETGLWFVITRLLITSQHGRCSRATMWVS